MARFITNGLVRWWEVTASPTNENYIYFNNKSEEQRLKKISEDIWKLIYLYNLMVDEIGKIEGEINDIWVEIENIKNDIIDLTNRVTDLENKVLDLQNQINVINNQITDIVGDIGDLDVRITDLENRVTIEEAKDSYIRKDNVDTYVDVSKEGVDRETIDLTPFQRPTITQKSGKSFDVGSGKDFNDYTDMGYYEGQFTVNTPFNINGRYFIIVETDINGTLQIAFPSTSNTIPQTFMRKLAPAGWGEWVKLSGNLLGEITSDADLFTIKLSGTYAKKSYTIDGSSSDGIINIYDYGNSNGYLKATALFDDKIYTCTFKATGFSGTGWKEIGGGVGGTTGDLGDFVDEIETGKKWSVKDNSGAFKSNIDLTHLENEINIINNTGMKEKPNYKIPLYSGLDVGSVGTVVLDSTIGAYNKIQIVITDTTGKAIGYVYTPVINTVSSGGVGVNYQSLITGVIPYGVNSSDGFVMYHITPSPDGMRLVFTLEQFGSSLPHDVFIGGVNGLTTLD